MLSETDTKCAARKIRTRTIIGYKHKLKCMLFLKQTSNSGGACSKLLLTSAGVPQFTIIIITLIPISYIKRYMSKV